MSKATKESGVGGKVSPQPVVSLRVFIASKVRLFFRFCIRES